MAMATTPVAAIRCKNRETGKNKPERLYNDAVESSDR